MPAQIVEKSGEGLSRVYNITVPANDLVTKLEAKIAEIGRKNNVTVSDQEVGQAMQQEAINMARQYGMQPQQVFDMLRQNPNAAAQIRAPLFEDKVVDLLFGQAKVTDKTVSKEELLKEDDLPAGYGG